MLEQRDGEAQGSCVEKMFKAALKLTFKTLKGNNKDTARQKTRENTQEMKRGEMADECF